MSKFLTRNNVKTTLAESITETSTQFRIFNATPPFRSPPSPGATQKVRLTIIDSSTPTKIEIIEAESIVIDGTDNRLITVTGNDAAQGRGLEGSTASSFSTGATIYMANTSDMISNKADRDDVILVERETINVNGSDYVKVKTEEATSGEIILFTYKL